MKGCLENLLDFPATSGAAVAQEAKQVVRLEVAGLILAPPS